MLYMFKKLALNLNVSLVFQLAIDYGIKFLETSAKSSTNVEEVRRNCLVTCYVVALVS